MNPQAIQLVIWLFGGLLARTVDTVIGGGGLFSVPALLLTGRSSQSTLGTNQLALSFGALAGTVKFSQKGNIRWWPETAMYALGLFRGPS